MTPHSSPEKLLLNPVSGYWRGGGFPWILAVLLLLSGAGCFPRLNGRRTFGSLELPKRTGEKSEFLADARSLETGRAFTRTDREGKIELVAAKPTIRSQDSAFVGGWDGHSFSLESASQEPVSLKNKEDGESRIPQRSGIQLQKPNLQVSGGHSLGPARPRLLTPQPVSGTSSPEPQITPAGSFFDSDSQTSSNIRRTDGSRVRLRNPERLNSNGVDKSPTADSSVSSERVEDPSTVMPSGPDDHGLSPAPENTGAPGNAGSLTPELSPASEQSTGAEHSTGPEQSEEPVKERTVLDRLRGLYPSRLEESSTELLRKNISRLQTPWNRRTATPEIEVPLPQLPVTADSTAGQTQGPANRSASETAGTEEINDGSQQLLQRLTAQLESELNAWPLDEGGQHLNEADWRRAQADLRLLYLISDRNADAVSAIATLTPDEQEFWQSLMLGLTHYRRDMESGEDPNEKLVATSEQLRAALQHLQAMAPLSIRRLSFTTRIHGFGSFDVLPTAEFNPGQPVLIYAEIDNFRSELTNGGVFRSEFMAVVEMLRLNPDDPTEHVVESIRVPSIVDETQSRRTDYFQSYELVIPSHLTSGKYQIRLRLRDQTSGQQAVATIDFTVR